MSPNSESLSFGYDAVETTVFCVLTRFKVRSPIDLLRFFLLSRQIRRASKRISGLITSLFLVENLSTFFTLSIWKDRDAVLRFNTIVTEHITSANWCFRRLRLSSSGRVLLWSAQFQLTAVSPHNLCWEGVDVEPYLIRTSRAKTVREPKGTASQEG